MFNIEFVNVDAPVVPVVVKVIAPCLLLNVVKSVELSAPLLVADAVGTFNVITGVVVPVDTVLLKSVPTAFNVRADTDVTVPVLLVYPDGLLEGYAPNAVNADDAVVEPVPPFAIATVPVTLAAVPVVLWFNVGKSDAIAILGTPVVVVFFNIPVVSPANDVPLILPTTVADCVPVTSPERLPVNEPDEPDTDVWSPVFVPVDVPEPEGAPTIVAVIPDTVPVNVGLARLAFKFKLL